jgi:elongation factor P
MGTISDVTTGSIIKYESGLYEVVDRTQVDQARGSAYLRTKLRNLSGKGTREITFQAGDDIEVVNIEYKNMQYLYKEGERYAFMNEETYDTIEVNEESLGEDKIKYLKEGLEVVMKTYQNRPVAMNLPDKIAYEVLEAPPAVKGDSASGSTTKTVTLENELEVDVPVFIERGEEIYVNTNSGEYDQRVN